MPETDEQYLTRRRREEEREFLIRAADPEVAPRLSPFLLALREAVQGTGRPLSAALAHALRSSDVVVKTGDSMVSKLIKHGFLIKQGEYKRTYNKRSKSWDVRDTRVLSLGLWPLIED